MNDRGPGQTWRTSWWAAGALWAAVGTGAVEVGAEVALQRYRRGGRCGQRSFRSLLKVSSDPRVQTLKERAQTTESVLTDF